LIKVPGPSADYLLETIAASGVSAIAPDVLARDDLHY
jgi:hypothetical protein